MSPLMFWLIFGAVLIALEFILPGMVTVFFGLAAWLVAAGIWLGFLDSWYTMIMTWMIASLVLVLGLRSLLARYITGDQETGNLDEDTEAYGIEVDVVESTEPDHMTGRIRFRGTLWNAVSLGDPLQAGGRARLLSRDNLRWVVEPVESKSEGDEL